MTSLHHLRRKRATHPTHAHNSQINTQCLQTQPVSMTASSVSHNVKQRERTGMGSVLILYFVPDPSAEPMPTHSAFDPHNIPSNALRRVCFYWSFTQEECKQHCFKKTPPRDKKNTQSIALFFQAGAGIV